MRKKVGKEGVCYGCYRKFLRSQLYICTGCMLAEYCSRECQRPIGNSTRRMYAAILK